MATAVLKNINLAILRIEQAISITFFNRFPPDAFGFAGGNVEQNLESRKFSLSDIIGDGFLWGVPKNRRTIERRLKRKYGSPQYVMKILLPKHHLRVCNTCGNDHEAGVLCPHCYKKVQKETEEMQEKIQAELALKPVEKEVLVMYDGEKLDEHADEFYKGKQIIEMKKPRPAWFTDNLLQKSTQEPSDTKDLKPTQLG